MCARFSLYQRLPHVSFRLCIATSLAQPAALAHNSSHRVSSICIPCYLPFFADSMQFLHLTKRLHVSPPGLCATSPVANPAYQLVTRPSRFAKFVILTPHMTIRIIHSMKDLETQFIQLNVDDYWSKIAEGLDVLQIELEIVVALDEEENKMKIDVISDRPKKPQIESAEDQPLVLVKTPTLPCTFGKPYKGVEVKEQSQIFYTADTLVLDDPDATHSFMLEVLNELPNLKEGVHASLLEYVDAPIVVDISKRDGIT
ncbi:hypothetical protein Scep_021776 [Stephania cephalantha]|uniref:Uncharacterized protein n=1 Tax=Stephania cephalantha TaxID=152367 RepID=A0AAP0F6R5_9MAGN